MDKKLLSKLKQNLEKEKEILEKELKDFAEENKEIKGDWKTRYPKFGEGKIDEEADALEEYQTLLPIEYNLELRLKDVNLALEKIKKSPSADGYGNCEKCGKPISSARLSVCPEARTCIKCK